MRTRWLALCAFLSGMALLILLMLDGRCPGDVVNAAASADTYGARHASDMAGLTEAYYTDDFSDYQSGWPREWSSTRGALYQVHPYEHPQCPGSDCPYQGDGYLIARRSGSSPQARFGPGVAVPSESYEIELDARWWDAAYFASYQIFFGSDKDLDNYYALQVRIDVVGDRRDCAYSVIRHTSSALAEDGTLSIESDKTLQDWSYSSNINCNIGSKKKSSSFDHWKIRRENDEITIWVNGAKLGEWDDSKFGANRYFGVGARLYEGFTPSKPEFDNWSVTVLPSDIPTPTPIPTPIAIDTYEPDDICTEASTLVTDGTAQRHTFHQQADEDWGRFTVISGTTYVVQAVSTSPDADLEMELYDACSQHPLTPDDEDTFGNDARLIFTAPSGGSYYIKALNHDPAVYGWSVTYELSARPRSSAPIVVIVAGRNEADQLEDNITFMGDQAYRTFCHAGVPRENIHYLSAGGNRDADQDGNLDLDGAPTWGNMRHAVQDWPRERGLQPGKPFYLYLADHGGTDYFCAGGCGDGMRVSAAELNGWLDDLESRTGADEVNVIVEACYSGSFIDVTTAATATVSSEGRVVIASTGSRARAFPSEHGGYFSDAFFTALGDNADLWTAYVAGRTAARAAWPEQTPWLDDNGDQVADGNDGEVARRRGLVALGGGSIPVVDWLQVGDVSESGTATITASVRDDVAVMTVTVEIYPPGFRPPDTVEGETPVLQIDRLVLRDADGDGVYEGEYASFTDEGIYRLVAYAWDIDGNLSLPRQATVGEKRVYLPLVMRGY